MRTLLKHGSRFWQTIAIAALGLVFATSVFSAQTILVSTGAVWRYFDLGMQPAAEWISPAFDDSTWRTGLAQLGFGDGDEATIINRVNTAYFRGTFSVANPAEVTSLTLDVWRDDGAIAYINGIEVLRDNMPPGPAGYFTLAIGPAIDDGEIPVHANVIPAVLVAGLNTIAVEIHQNSATSSDMTLDLMLIADTTQANQPPVANNQNAVAVQKTATAITLTGSDPDGNPLAFVITSSPTHGTLSGTPPNVTYTSAPAYVGADSFTFKVNDGSLDSADATISIQVVAPPDPPEVISAVGNCTTVVVTFNEPLDPINATEEVSNYAVLDSFGLGASIGSATLSPDQQAVTLVLDFPLSPATSYTLHILFVCDVSGDCARNQSVPVQFDTRPPIVVCATAIDNLWPANHELTDVGLTAVSSSGTFQVQVFSDEPDGGGDALFADGVLKLLSQREGKSDGRVYLIVVTSTDACGNVAACCTTIIAPHDSSQAALESVSGQAAAAQAQCSPTGAPLTPYRLLP